LLITTSNGVASDDSDDIRVAGLQETAQTAEINISNLMGTASAHLLLVR
jgi:hypothetical protein